MDRLGNVVHGTRGCRAVPRMGEQLKCHLRKYLGRDQGVSESPKTSPNP
jgi:hypothetical protein